MSADDLMNCFKMTVDMNGIKKIEEYISKLEQENKKLNGTIQTYDILLKSNVEENAELKKQLEEVEFIVGLRQKRNLIHKFDKEYDEEDKKKNPNRNYAGIMPDAEEVYRRYYGMKNQQQEFIKYLEDEINKTDYEINILGNYPYLAWSNACKKNLQKYKEIIGKDINVRSKGENK